MKGAVCQMRKKILWIGRMTTIAIILSGFSISASASNAGQVTGDMEQDIRLQVQKLVKDEQLQGAVSGISIRSASSGRILYSFNGSMRLRPASNLKLLTAAAALYTLRKDYVFTTSVLTDGKKKGTTLKGNLYLKGGGDPSLRIKDIENLAKALKCMKIDKVEGNLYADESHFDSVRYPVDMPWSDEDTYYGAGISALTVSSNNEFAAGTSYIEITPSKRVGEKARIHVIPDNDYLKIQNNVYTVKENGKKRVTLKREHGKNTAVIKGEIPLRSQKIQERTAVWEPALYTSALFKSALEKEGIQILGKTGSRVKAAPEKSEALVSHQSLPLSTLLLPLLKHSNNTFAEMLTKEMGRKVYGNGDWDHGIKAVNTALEILGLNTKTLLLRDGSGISQADLVTADEITKLLFSIQKYSWFPQFLTALPVAGESSKQEGGSLRSRFKETAGAGRILAKTGSLTGVSSLSGYITSVTGGKLIFSILINNFISGNIEDIEDKIALSLVNIQGWKGRMRNEERKGIETR